MHMFYNHGCGSRIWNGDRDKNAKIVSCIINEPI